MFAILRLLLSAAIGAGLGLGSVWLVLNDPRFDLSPRIGVWRIAHASGEGLSDPYSVARTARSGRIALGAAEGVALVAARDSDGLPLDPTCHYRVRGPIPAGDLWTISVTGPDGRLPRNPAERLGFSGRDAIREADGTVVVGFGPTMRPGNFIPTTGLGAQVVTLRIYSTSLSGRLPDETGLPTVERVACGGPPRVR